MDNSPDIQPAFLFQSSYLVISPPRGYINSSSHVVPTRPQNHSFCQYQKKFSFFPKGFRSNASFVIGKFVTLDGVNSDDQNHADRFNVSKCRAKDIYDGQHQTHLQQNDANHRLINNKTIHDPEKSVWRPVGSDASVPHDAFHAIQNCGLVLCVRADNPETAYHGSLAAIRGGIQCLEIALTTPGAIDVLEQLILDHPQQVASVSSPFVMSSSIAASSKNKPEMDIYAVEQRPSLLEHETELYQVYQHGGSPGSKRHDAISKMKSSGRSSGPKGTFTDDDYDQDNHFPQNNPQNTKDAKQYSTQNRLWIGAGSVLQHHQVRDLSRIGVSYAFSPITDKAIIQHCHSRGILAIPGAITPNEVYTAAKVAGAHVVKLFPVNIFGGLNLVKSFQGPLPDIPLIPTSGIQYSEISSYLSQSNVLGIGVSKQIVDPVALEKGDWETIEKKAMEWVDCVNR